MKKATIQLETLTCPSCSAKITNAIKGQDGVDADSVSVHFNSSRAKFNFDDTKLSVEDIVKAINAVGYEVKKTQVK